MLWWILIKDVDPVGHAMHCDWPSKLAKEPTGHGKHVPLRGKAYDPAGQGLHAVRLGFTSV